MDPAAQYALAYALTTSAGVRALVPLVAVSFAAHLGYIHPPEQIGWLGSTTVTAILVAVALAEIFADKIPLVDHALHFVQVATKPAAGAILVAGVAHPQNRDVLIGLMVLGALNALGIHAVTSSIRLGSTAATAGLGNPILSTTEDVAAVGTTLLAFVAPFAAAVIALLLVFLLARLLRAVYRRTRQAH